MPAQETSSPISSRHKALLIGVAVAGFIALSVLVIFWPHGSCEEIFKQTAPKLEAHLEIIKQKGALAVGHEQVQELSKSAQKVGLHLKTCCTVLDGGKLDPDQFQQCIDKASAYDQQIALVAQQLTEAAEAKEKGASDVLQEKIASIDQAIETATRHAEEFARQAKEIKPPKPEPNGVAKPRQALASTEAQTSSVRVEVQELKRDNGTVTLKFTMINDSNRSFGGACYFRETASEGCGRITGVYLFDVTEKKIYPVVRDANGKCVCGEVGELSPKSRATLWAKFPALPKNVQKISVVIPHFIPMDDVPISR